MSKAYLVLHNGVSLFLQGDVIAEEELGADETQRRATIARLVALGAVQLTDAEPTHTGAYASRLSVQESDVNLPEFAKYEMANVTPTTSHAGAYNPPTLVDNVPLQTRTGADVPPPAMPESTPVNNAFSRAEETPDVAAAAVKEAEGTNLKSTTKK